MNKVSLCVYVLLALVMSGCGGSSRAVEPAYNYTPDLRSFDLIDSYGTDTAVSNSELVLDPYIEGGWFDVFWKVNSLEDYRVNFLVNKYPDLIGSVLVDTARCGAGLACDQSGGFPCEYYTNYTMSCDDGATIADIYHLFPEFPATLFLILEVCDLDSTFCEYDYYPVIME